jgi:multidrug efflux pump subunit AcrA (membrane-fusion protein)
LRIGDFVDVTVASDPKANAIAIPASALIGQTEVWVVDQGQLETRTITVLGELDSGNRIVVSPFDIADGIVAVAPLEAEVGQEVVFRVSENVGIAAGGRSDAAE